MQCYACGNELNEQDYCTACGADVGFYKKIIQISNRLYNDALDKARVRDLSGAVKCLRQSLRLYRGNIDARNLLGLIYYEMGEVVAALTEWVISKNLREERNLAGDLLEMVQREPQRLETLGRTSKKYNLALNYARQESYDLAVIQLKRILQLNPGFLRARELLALLYLKSEEYERAKLECNRCLRIDSGDTKAKRYLKEVQTVLAPGEAKRPRRGNSDIVRYQSGNETIIQPQRHSVSGGIFSFAMLLLGLGLGIAIAWFLILPARVTRIQQAAKQELASVSEESDAKSVQIRNLEQEQAKLSEQITELEKEAEAAGEAAPHESADALMLAVASYLRDPEDMASIKSYMVLVDKDAPEMSANEDVRRLYNDFRALVGKNLAAAFYNEGYEAFRAENDISAIASLKRASELDEENEFYLARAYYRSGDTENARDAFELVVDRFPDTNLAAESQNMLAEINNSGV